VKKRKILTRPTAIASMQFDEVDADMSQVRAERLQTKAMRKMRQQLA
jgi:hypothetical protein